MTRLLMLTFLSSLLFPGVAFLGRLRRDFHDLTNLERLGFVFLVSLLHICAFSFGLAAFQIFRVEYVWGLLALSTLVYWLFLRPSKEDVVSLLKQPKRLLIAVVLACIGYYAFPQPSEWLTNYHMDAGRYSNAASFILEDGGYILRNEVLPFSNELEESDYNNFPGMFGTGQPGEFTVPYTHLFPALQAFYRGHVGIYHSFTLNWLLGLGAALLIYTLIKLVSRSDLAGLLGAVLYFSNGAAQLYFIRNYTETLSTVLFLALGILFWCFERKSSYLYSALLAFTVALLCFCRLDMGVLYLLIPGLVGVVMLFSNWKPPKHYLCFLILNLLWLAPIVLYYHSQASGYVYLNTRQNIGLVFDALGYNYKAFRPFGHLYWFAFCALVLLFNVLLFRFGRKLFEVSWLSSAKTDYFLATAITIGLGLFLLYNATLRPYFVVVNTASFHHDAINLARLFYFLDPLMWILAVLGLRAALLPSEFRIFAFLIAAMVFLTILSSSHSPTLFFWIRRYIPLVIPGIVILASLKLWKFRPALRYSIFLVCLSFNVFTTKAIVHGFVEKDGVFIQFEGLSQSFEENAIQLCMMGDDCNKVAVPLDSHFGIDSFYLQPGLNKRKIRIIRRLIKSGRPVYLNTVAPFDFAFTAEERKMFHRARIKVEQVAQSYHVAPMLMGLEDEWSVDKGWSNLYRPRVLLGTRRFGGRKFPSFIFRLSLKGKS